MMGRWGVRPGRGGWGCGCGLIIEDTNNKKKWKEKEKKECTMFSLAAVLYKHRDTCNKEDAQTHTIGGRRGEKNNKPVRILLGELMGIKYLGG